jgi:hypothetical protein
MPIRQIPQEFFKNGLKKGFSLAKGPAVHFKKKDRPGRKIKIRGA